MPDRAETTPIPVVIVASWYPAVDDPARGRFVADQAEALAATGKAHPVVLSFDTALVDGARVRAVAAAGLVSGHVGAAMRSGMSPLSPRGWGLEPTVPVARPSLLEGVGRALPPGTDGDLRRDALIALAAALDMRSWPTGVVHAHTAYPDGYAAAGLARMLGWPLVVTEHASFVARQLGNPATRQRYLTAVDVADRFLAVSDALAGELAQAIPSLERKLAVMPNTVPLHRYTPTGLDGRRANELLFAGYRKPTKGIATLLRAFADVREARPDARLRLIGRSPTQAIEDGWLELCRELGIEDAVDFDAPLDRTGIAEAMSRTSLLVHASPRETFGMTTLEALASGTPVVAARSGGISHILEDRELGELVPPHDSRALARGVLRALDRRDSFDPAYLRRAVEPYASERVATRLMGIYQEIIEPRAEAKVAGADPLGSLPRPWPIPERLLVLAHDTARAESLLRAMPRALLGRMLVVTHDPVEGTLPDELGRVLFTRDAVGRSLRRSGLHGPRGSRFDRVRRLVGDPIGAVRRRLAPGGPAEIRWEAMVAGVAGAMGSSDDVTRFLAAGDCEIVCMDAIDHAVAEGVSSSAHLTIAPGGLLWLADRCASAGAPALGEAPSPQRVGSPAS